MLSLMDIELVVAKIEPRLYSILVSSYEDGWKNMAELENTKDTILGLIYKELDSLPISL